MGRKAILEKRKARLEAKKATLVTKAQASQSVEEVRELTEQVEELNAEIEETEEELNAIAEEERAAAPVPAGATLVNPLEKKASFNTRESNDKFGSMEYRQAFKAFIQKGTPIPAEYRDAANTETLGATIPTTILNEFINEVKGEYGNLYAKVRKLNVKGGVKIPLSKLKASFKWITEDTVSPRQDGGESKEFVEFSYNTAEIRIAQTLLSSIVGLDLFESEIVSVMVEAFLEAMDSGIVAGTGKGQMLGIINDERITQVVEMTANEFDDWKAWRKKLFKNLKKGYRSGEFIFAQSTVDAHLETMSDANNNPIFRQATGLEVADGDTLDSGRFFGRVLETVENDIIADFDDAEAGDVVGIYWVPSQYGINTNMQFTIRRYYDEDANEWVNKAIAILDGKPMNPKAFWLIKKK